MHVHVTQKGKPATVCYSTINAVVRVWPSYKGTHDVLVYMGSTTPFTANCSPFSGQTNYLKIFPNNGTAVLRGLRTGRP